ncbi:tyrosine-type recombinase/integrase [Saccharothrix algeriensis]|uniref:Integrase n=2 Tax=Saccharothrix algeriensis TaxID=173560 RepID=A0ABS2S565_9PSEU|nr:tyrosine-type recombinase/integrase [Saccharothrix algeriensis]MBM7811054.1 integrase [Saccharothrix algeriensis]
MGTAKARKTTRQRGEILPLPSGSLKVRVYAGIDPLTGKRNYLTHTVPHTAPNPEREAERVRTRLLNQVDERRAPRTKATVNMLFDKYEETLDQAVERTTAIGYRRNIRLHIRPLLGHLQIGKALNGETFDSFDAILKQCSLHCGGRGDFIEHRKSGEHKCTDKCRRHKCRGLSNSTILKIHSCLNSALEMALRWDWISVNPMTKAKQPAAPKPKPNPPTPEEAAAIVNDAFRDISWGVFLWLAMTTGARRGELCAASLDNLDLVRKTLFLKSAIAQEGGDTWEKDLKDHQQRRIALDDVTVQLLKAYLKYREDLAAEMDVKLKKKGRIFSNSFDHSTYVKPNSMTQRYTRTCQRLGIGSKLHALRHYSVTELIVAGVDVRTIAGRVGHSGGGTTTLRVYAAWSSEADQQAAQTLTGRMPAAPLALDSTGTPVAALEPEVTGPYRQIALDFRGAIACGMLRPGDTLPTVVEIRSRYGVSAGTANRAVAELKAWGLVTASRGKRAVVVGPASTFPQNAEVVEMKKPPAAR